MSIKRVHYLCGTFYGSGGLILSCINAIHATIVCVCNLSLCKCNWSGDWCMSYRYHTKIFHAVTMLLFPIFFKEDFCVKVVYALTICDDAAFCTE
jgi:hypothetical protein